MNFNNNNNNVNNVNINKQSSLDNSLILNEKSSEVSKLTREEKFKMMLEKYADSSPEKAPSKKIEKAKQRCNLLYEKGKIKNEVNKLINQKNSELREQKELSECTFKPRTNSSFKKSSVGKEFDEKGIYDRAINWKKRKIEK